MRVSFFLSMSLIVLPDHTEKRCEDIMEKSKRSFLPWGMVSTILTLAWPTMLEELMQTAV